MLFKASMSEVSLMTQVRLELRFETISIMKASFWKTKRKTGIRLSGARINAGSAKSNLSLVSTVILR
jgi:hypothetical protein